MDAYMDYGKYGDNHYQCASDERGGSCYCQYGTRQEKGEIGL